MVWTIVHNTVLSLGAYLVAYSGMVRRIGLGMCLWTLVPGTVLQPNLALSTWNSAGHSIQDYSLLCIQTSNWITPLYTNTWNTHLYIYLHCYWPLLLIVLVFSFCASASTPVTLTCTERLLSDFTLFSLWKGIWCPPITWPSRWHVYTYMY